MTTGLGASLRRGVGGAPAKGPWSPALVTFHLDLCLGPSVRVPLSISFQKVIFYFYIL